MKTNRLILSLLLLSSCTPSGLKYKLRDIVKLKTGETVTITFIHKLGKLDYEVRIGSRHVSIFESEILEKIN